MWHFPIATIASLVVSISACEGDHSCYGPLKDDVVLTRNVRRMQPDAQNTTTSPKAPLEWGQINFLHTTDTHGWLEGHIKEQNYGADWYVKPMFKTHSSQTLTTYQPLGYVDDVYKVHAREKLTPYLLL
jgi:2',3'-cyclic-nucleotide 2'-phosphodiesterase (5'-nucleotidase family)